MASGGMHHLNALVHVMNSGPMCADGCGCMYVVQKHVAHIVKVAVRAMYA